MATAAVQVLELRECPGCGSQRIEWRNGKICCHECYGDYVPGDVQANRVGTPEEVRAASCSRLLMPTKR